MATDADRNFADLLSVRCASRAEDLIAILPDERRSELRRLLAANAELAKEELLAGISARVTTANPQPDLDALPRAFRKYLARTERQR